MTNEEIQARLNAENDETCKDGPSSMVYQIWEDGEITLQKNGDLLWQRNLHCIFPGHPRFLAGQEMDLPNKRWGHSFIWARPTTVGWFKKEVWNLEPYGEEVANAEA